MLSGKRGPTAALWEEPEIVQLPSKTAWGADLSELAFWNSIPVENDPGRLVAGRLVELDEQLAHHRGQILDDLLPGSLDTHSSTVSAGMSVHAANHLKKKMKLIMGSYKKKKDKTFIQMQEFKCEI